MTDEIQESVRKAKEAQSRAFAQLDQEILELRATLLRTEFSNDREEAKAHSDLADLLKARDYWRNNLR